MVTIDIEGKYTASLDGPIPPVGTRMRFFADGIKSIEVIGHSWALKGKDKFATESHLVILCDEIEEQKER